MENLHILFWLLKDLGWCMIWKPLGISMILPTLGIALVITWRTCSIRAELAHNLAIVFWISANSYWMVCEFVGFDTVRVWGGVTGKHLALLPFLMDLGVLVYYYLVQKPREVEPEQVTAEASASREVGGGARTRPLLHNLQPTARMAGGGKSRILILCQLPRDGYNETRKRPPPYREAAVST